MPYEREKGNNRNVRNPESRSNTKELDKVIQLLQGV